MTKSETLLSSARKSFISLADLVGESEVCESLAQVYIESDNLTEATELASKATTIANDLGNVKQICESCATLALAHFLSGKLTMAHEAVTTALRCVYLPSIPYAWIVRGILELKQGNNRAADDSFKHAFGNGEHDVGGKKENVSLLVAQALALNGLAKLKLGRFRTRYMKTCCHTFGLYAFECFVRY